MQKDNLVQIRPGFWIKVDHNYKRAMDHTRAQALIKWHESLGKKWRPKGERAPLSVCKLISAHCVATGGTIDDALKATGYDKVYSNAKIRKSVFEWRREGNEIKMLGKGVWRDESKRKQSLARKAAKQQPPAPTHSGDTHPSPTSAPGQAS